MRSTDDIDNTLNPHRAEEVAAAGLETANRLGRRGIVVSGKEDSEELADLLTAVERFEEVVERSGGDLMVDDLKSTEPDNPQFVVPRRARGESLRDYIGRIDEATARLRHHRKR